MDSATVCSNQTISKIKKENSQEEPDPSSRRCSRAEKFRFENYPGLNQKDWNDWRWQIKNRIHSLEDVQKFIYLYPDEVEALKKSAVSITPYYTSLIDPIDYFDPIRRAVIPLPQEFVHSTGESEDPLNEESYCVAPNIIHRYPDRVLFLVTNFCSVKCRYCTRSRLVDCSKEKTVSDVTSWSISLDYIRDHKEIRDVLLSGGDPLTFNDTVIEWLLTELKKISHIEMIRIGTKVPAVLPQRITSRLTNMLHKFHPLWMSLHFTHPRELTPEVSEACERLADAGIPLGSQTVLLKGINDHVEVLKLLFQGLLKMRVRPYYLYSMDPIIGSSHFRAPIESGIEIIRGLRGHTTGYAVPTYVIDAPGGGGKIPIGPDYVVERNDKGVIMKNYQGNIYKYIC
jgi:lysine 2,3-aminomutase